MEITIDIKKMLESILKELWHHPLNSWLFECIKAALKDQGLKYNSVTKKIEYIKQEISKLEVGKLYKCTKDCYTAVGEKILSEGKLYHCTAENEIFSEFGGRIWVGDLLCYLCPATSEEIPHSESEQEELNEFEKWFKKLIGCYASAMGTPLIEQPEDRQNDFVKKHAQSLLSIARKQIASEINVDEMVQKFKDGVEENPHGILACLTLHGAYKLGMDDTLKAIKVE